MAKSPERQVIILAGIAILAPAAVRAAETDQYTVPESEVADITDTLNTRANQLLSEAIGDLNASGGCAAPGAEDDLYNL